jgi:hypothetical protein
MTWKAIERIGGYEIGDIVPDETAIAWNQMYKTSPVEFVEEPQQKLSEKPEPVKSKGKRK